MTIILSSGYETCNNMNLKVANFSQIRSKVINANWKIVITDYSQQILLSIF